MNDFAIRSMTRPELDVALDWAAKEGWNPGLHDANAFWSGDTEDFIVAERRGEVIGVCANVSYDSHFGFVGLFIVRPDCRGKGVGRALWNDSLKLLRGRLQPGKSIGLDGVLPMRAYYEKHGFVFYGRHIRFEGVGAKPATPPESIAPMARVPFDNLLAIDTEHFPAARRRFFSQWMRLPDSAGFAATPRGTMGKLGGYAIVRKCRNGFKIGPLFAKDDASAENLFNACSAHAVGQPLFLDVPEGNAAGLALAAKHNMKEVFSCARMYQGPAPAHKPGIYGVTTLELG